jgi:hypothetical protein
MRSSSLIISGALRTVRFMEQLEVDDPIRIITECQLDAYKDDTVIIIFHDLPWIN